MFQKALVSLLCQCSSKTNKQGDCRGQSGVVHFEKKHSCVTRPLREKCRWSDSPWRQRVTVTHGSSCIHSPVIVRWSLVRANEFAIIKELNQMCDISSKRQEGKRARERAALFQCKKKDRLRTPGPIPSSPG